MAFFQSRKIQSSVVIIIIAVIALWMGQEFLSPSTIEENQSTASETIKEQKKEAPYLEKIDNFALEEYTEDHLLSHFIEAEIYYNYENSPVKLINTRVTTYDENGKEGFVLTSNRANILRSGEVFFNGEVSIRSRNGPKHEIETESLIVREKMQQIASNRDVVYLGENFKVYAQGMLMSAESDTMELKGDVRIKQDSGATIESNNIFVDESGGNKHYHSKEPTAYLSEMSKINAEDGFDLDMNKDYLKLLGKVEVLQKSGGKIVSRNLIVDQSNGAEIYKSAHQTLYQSQATEINARSMYYDTQAQIIELMGGVVGRYE